MWLWFWRIVLDIGELDVSILQADNVLLEGYPTSFFGYSGASLRQSTCLPFDECCQWRMKPKGYWLQLQDCKLSFFHLYGFV